MINTIKWAIYHRCHGDTDRAKGIFEAIYRKLNCTEWGDETQWTEQQEDLFYEAIDLLLPVNTEDDIIKLVQSVFGKVRVLRDDSGYIRPSTEQVEAKG